MSEENTHVGKVRKADDPRPETYVWRLPGLSVQKLHKGLAETLVARANKTPKYAYIMNRFGGRTRKGMLRRVLLRTTTLYSQSAI